MSEKELIIPNGADVEIYKAQVEAGEVEPKYKEEPAKEHIDTEPKPADPKGDEGDGKDKPEGEIVDGEKGQPNRPIEHIPAWKHKEELKKAREQAAAEARAEANTEFEKRLIDAGQKPGGATGEDIDGIAAEFGLDPNLVPAFIDRLAGAVSSRVKLPDEFVQATNDIKEQQRQVKESQGFEDEWAGEETRSALASISGGKEISAGIKEKIKELAYTPTYHRYRIADIVRLEGSKLLPAKESKSAEAGRGGASRGTASPKIEEMSPEDIYNLPDDEFNRLSDELGKSGSRFIKTTKKK